MKKIVQTAGRDHLGEFAPAFAHYNDDVLFGEDWNDETLDPKTKSIIVLSVFMGRGLVTDALKSHLEIAKKNGVTKKEIAALITHAAFYAGWPVAWAVFGMAQKIWTDEETETGALPEEDKGRVAYEKTLLFPIGEPNTAFQQYFEGQSYLSVVAKSPLPISNVTFEPGCRNHWHIHHASKGGGQVLICVGGRGYYQEWGKDPVEMTPGSVIEIPAGVKHWHGAAPDSWFSHLAFEIPGENTSNEWLEPVYI